MKNKIDLWICSNEPEICDFMTNNLSSKTEIRNCKHCDGYMIVKMIKKDHNKLILGCTNYKENGTGCNEIYNIN